MFIIVALFTTYRPQVRLTRYTLVLSAHKVFYEFALTDSVSHTALVLGVRSRLR